MATPSSSNPSQTPASSSSSSNAQQSSRYKELDDPVTKLKSSIPLLKEVITVWFK
jgi:hypothetical protein